MVGQIAIHTRLTTCRFESCLSIQAQIRALYSLGVAHPQKWLWWCPHASQSTHQSNRVAASTQLCFLLSLHLRCTRLLWHSLCFKLAQNRCSQLLDQCQPWLSSDWSHCGTWSCPTRPHRHLIRTSADLSRCKWSWSVLSRLRPQSVGDWSLQSHLLGKQYTLAQSCEACLLKGSRLKQWWEQSGGSRCHLQWQSYSN